MNKWAKSICESGKRSAIPIMTHPGIDLIGKSIKDAVSDGEIQYKAIKAIRDTYPVAASTMMMDLTVEAEAFGSKINFSEKEIPSVAERLVSDNVSIDKLKIPGLEVARIPEYLKAAKLAVENIKDRPVLAGCIGPFSLAGRLFDLSEIMTALYIEPDMIKRLLEKCSEFILAYVSELKKAGTDGIIMAEPAAGLLSLEMCDEFSSYYIRPIVEKVQDDDFLFVLHNCGNTGNVTKSMISTGAGALHFGNKIAMAEVLKEVPRDIIVMGNLDPVGVFKMSGPEEVFNAATTLLRQTSEYNNYIISSGCDTPPGVPEENIKAFFEAVDVYNG